MATHRPATRRPNKGEQLELKPRAWGGKRDGAGRKKSGARIGVPHRARPAHHWRFPLHVTMRAVEGLPTLRERALYGVICGAIAAANTKATLRDSFRVLQFSVQANHLHLFVEADDADTLTRGIQGLAIRLARRINGALRTTRGRRRGNVWNGRYHARELKTPREVRNGLVYVLHNLKKHRPGERGLDVCSSASAFNGWRNLEATARLDWLPGPRTWLARTGWTRARPGLLSVHERPGAAVRGKRSSRSQQLT
jgi:REP element-mobilizing transposase RayT